MPYRLDPLLRELIPAFPADFVRLLFPDLAKRIDLEALSFQREEYFLPGPRGGPPRRPDLVGKAHGQGGRDALLHVELENRFRASRIGGFFDYNQLLRLSSGLSVHTAVVYCHGGQPGVQEQVHTDVSLGETITEFHYRSLGLSRHPANSLLRLDEPLAWAFAALAQPEGRQSCAALRVACLERIVAAKHLPEDQRFRLFNFVATVVHSDMNLADEYEQYLRRANQEVQETMMTWAEAMEEKGRLDALQTAAISVLEERFSRVPAKVADAIRAIRSAERLTEIVRKAAVADSPADVGVA